MSFELRDGLVFKFHEHAESVVFIASGVSADFACFFFVVIYINFHYNYLDDKINIIIFALELNNICSDGVIGSRAGLKIL